MNFLTAIKSIYRDIVTLLAVMLLSMVGISQCLHAEERISQTSGLQRLDQDKWSVVASIIGTPHFRDDLERHLPFKLESLASASASPRKVFIYYFPFFLASMDNLPVLNDHWAKDYLRREGENGKYSRFGGFARERPLTQGPWASTYWRQVNEARDVLEARALGADGFIVGLQQLDQGGTLQISMDVCAAAIRFGDGFSVIASPDGAVLKDASVDNIARLVALYQAACSATFQFENGLSVLAPFAAQNETPSYWGAILKQLAILGRPEALIPILLDPVRNAAPFQAVSAGMSYWGSRDPLSMVDPTLSQSLAVSQRTAPVWMQPVTAQDMRPKDAIFWESRNTEAFRTAWMQAIESKASWVDIITWNDYSEATEIQPASGTQFLFYDLSAYYISWFKT